MQTPNHHRNNLNNGNNLELEVDVLVDSSVVFGHVDKDIEGTLTIKMNPLYIVINCFSIIEEKPQKTLQKI